MKATAKCSNPDCKKYDLKRVIQLDQGSLKPMYCDNCLIGKLQVHIQLIGKEHEEDEELTLAEFDVRKIFKRQG